MPAPSMAGAEDARYCDLLMAGEGRVGIAAMIGATRERFPGHGFTLTGTPDGHGPYVRFSWALAPANGAPAAQCVRVKPS